VGYQWAGDYSRGRGVARGDLFGSILGGIKGAIKGIVGASAKPPAFPNPLDIVPFLPTQDPFRGTRITTLPRMPGGGLGGGGGGGFAPEGMVCDVKGHHLNKRGYFTKRSGWVPPKSRCVKNRRMNPGNVRALRRGFRRVHSFARLARSVISFTHRVRMKKGRRAR